MKSRKMPKKELLGYIKTYIKKNRMPPTRAEIARYFTVYPNAVQESLDRLARDGYIYLIPKISRGIILTETTNANSYK